MGPIQSCRRGRSQRLSPGMNLITVQRQRLAWKLPESLALLVLYTNITDTSQCTGMMAGGCLSCAFHDQIQSLSEYTSQILRVLEGRHDFDMSVPGVQFSCCSSNTVYLGFFFPQRSTCPRLPGTRSTGGHYHIGFLWKCWRLISGSQTFCGRDLPNEL